MKTVDEQAFLKELISVMTRHGVKYIYATYDGEICVGYEDGDDGYYLLGNLDEIEHELKNL